MEDRERSERGERVGARGKSLGAREPKYRRSRRKTGDLAFVELNGRRIYLGKFGTQESRDRYHQVLAEWAASGRHLPAAKNEITVLELIARFWEHAQAYYRNGTGELTGSSEAYMSLPARRCPTLPAGIGPAPGGRLTESAGVRHATCRPLDARHRFLERPARRRFEQKATKETKKTLADPPSWTLLPSFPPVPIPGWVAGETSACGSPPTIEARSLHRSGMRFSEPPLPEGMRSPGDPECDRGNGVREHGSTPPGIDRSGLRGGTGDAWKTRCPRGLAVSRPDR